MENNSFNSLEFEDCEGIKQLKEVFKDVIGCMLLITVLRQNLPDVYEEFFKNGLL